MVRQQFPAALLEAKELERVRADVAWVEVGGSARVGEGEGRGVPGGVVVDDVFEPVFRVREGGAGVEAVDGGDFAAGLHGGEDEVAVGEAVGGEDCVELGDLLGG